MTDTSAADLLQSIVTLAGAAGGRLTLTVGDKAQRAVWQWPSDLSALANAKAALFNLKASGQLTAGTLELFNADRLSENGVSNAAQLLAQLFANSFAEPAASPSAPPRPNLAAEAGSDRLFRTLADTLPQMVWSTLPDGYHDYYNKRWYEFTGMPEGSTDGEGWNGMFHPEDQERAWARWRHSLETGEPYEIEYRLRNAQGEYRWTLGRALPMRDDAGKIVRWFGTCTDIHEQRLLFEQRQLVSQELSHRIKNIFAIVAGLISMSRRRHPETGPVLDDMRARVLALGRAHDFVRPHSEASADPAGPATLAGLLRELFAPYQSEHRTRIAIEGDDFPIDDQATTPIALVFHELATNAVKYGALSVDQGSVAVLISKSNGTCRCRWQERDGPLVGQRPDTTGFGTSLVDLSITRQLGGTISKSWDNAGLTVDITIPLNALQRNGLK